MPQDHVPQQAILESAWCPGCRVECAVEIVQLPGDPAPVAVCLQCGGGVEVWWQLPAAPPARPSRAS
ncbi:MAG: hypothetical protein ACRDRZ_14875 [Pseudonocardiaceae bacterium]